MAERLPRMLRCFCNCSTMLTAEEVKYILLSTMEVFVRNPTATKLFRSFLQLGRPPSDKPKVLLALECYQLCEEIARNEQLRTEDNLEKLMILCDSYQWEMRIEDAQLCEDPSLLVIVLEDLMTECLNRIAEDDDYHRFRAKLSAKLNG